MCCIILNLLIVIPSSSVLAIHVTTLLSFLYLMFTFHFVMYLILKITCTFDTLLHRCFCQCPVLWHYDPIPDLNILTKQLFLFYWHELQTFCTKLSSLSVIKMPMYFSPVCETFNVTLLWFRHPGFLSAKLHNFVIFSAIPGAISITIQLVHSCPGSFLYHDVTNEWNILVLITVKVRCKQGF